MSKFDDFDVLVRHKNGKFIAGVPQFGLFAKGDTAHSAFDALEAKKKAFLADLEESGELGILDMHDAQTSIQQGGPSRAAGGLGQFTLKAGIVALIIVAALATSGILIASTVARSVERTVDQVKSVKIGGSQFWSKLEDELDRMARPGNDLPEAKKQKIIADIRMIGAKWAPFVAELRSALPELDKPPRPDASTPK